MMILMALMMLCGGAKADENAETEAGRSSGGRTQTEAEEAESTGETAYGEQPLLIQITEEDTAAAYVLVMGSGPVGLLPLPAEGEYLRPIRQTLPDGSEWVNVVHLTPEGFWMESSNCEGQDCVEEGTVTLENREERILGNLVICLPHELVLELLTREEVLRMLGQ